MKKLALALSLFGSLTASAWAQSGVSISGILDLAITKGNGGTAANQGANGTSKAWIEKQSTASRLIFRGNEDLGGGLSAQFYLDHRFTPDDGVAGAIFWGGRSYVQLTSASVGAVWLGRDYVMAFAPAVRSDPFGWDGVGQIALNQFADFRSTDGVRVANAVGYKSPVWNGLTVNAAVSLGEGVTNRETGFNVQYAVDKIYAAMGYEKISNGPVARLNGDSLVNLAFHYDFGFIRPMLYTARAKTNGGRDASKQWMIGATIPVGTDKVKIVYSDYQPAGGVASRRKFGLGYEHYLSKRTNLYADFGLGKEERRTDNRAFALGVRHTF